MKKNGFKRWSLVVLSLLNISLLLTGQTLPTGAVAYYPFNGNANDESGNGHNPLYVHETWATTDRFGRANCAKYFDGNDYIQGSAVGLPTGDRTISLWLNRESVTPIAQIPFAYGGNPCGTSFFMALDNNTFRTSSYCNVNLYNYTDATFANNVWKHWVVVVSGSQIKMYLNGIEVSNNPFTGQTNINSNQFAIGACVNPQGYAPFAGDPNLNVDYFKGKLDDIRIYGRALTTAEIGELYREPNPAIVNTCRYQDSLQLVALYNATGGANWRTKTNWLTANPINTWYGIQTNADGCVTCIDLDGVVNCSGWGHPATGNNLIGTIPTSLINLSQLQFLSLAHNRLTGTIPTNISNLAELRHLSLAENQLTGAIPTSLGNLVHLSVLNIGNNRLSGNIPTELGNCTNMLILYMNDNLLTGSLPASFSNMSQLVVMHLASNQLTGAIPSNWERFPQMTECWLQNNQLSGSIPNNVGNWTSLNFLILYQNQLTGNIPDTLGALRNLNYLGIGYNQLTGNIPSRLGNCTQMIQMDFTRNQLTGNIPVSLGNLRRMEELNLSHNLLTGNLPDTLCTLPSMYKLALENNRFTGNIPLFRLPILRTLLLQDNQLQGCIPPSIRINCTGMVAGSGNISNNPNLSTQNWANYWNNGAGACMPTYQDSTTALQCGSRTFTWREHSFNQAGTYTDTVSSMVQDSIFTLTLREDLSCRCQDSIVMASMYHNAGGYPAAWDLRQPFTDWTGLKFNAAGCLEQFTYPVSDSVRCVRPHANDTLKADFGFFTYMQLQNHWLKDNNFFRTQNALILNDFQRLDTGRYIAKRTISNGGFALIPTLRTIYSRAIRLNYCCPTTRDTTRQRIPEGNCISWGGIRRCTTGTYSDTLQNAEGCDSIRVLRLEILPCRMNLQLQVAQNCLTAHATSIYPIVQYSWSKNGISMGAISNLCVQTSGLYKVQVKDSAGCTQTDSFRMQLTGRFYLDSTRMNCVDNNIYTPILLRQNVRNAEGYTVRINYDPTKVEPDNNNHLYKYLMSNPDSSGIRSNIVNGNQLVLTFFPTSAGMMNGNIGDILINIAWKPVGNVVNNSLTTLSGWVEESIQGMGGQEIYAITNPIRFTRQAGRILTWFFNTNNGSHQQSALANPTQVKVGTPTQMTTLGIVGGGGTFEINPMIGNHIGIQRQSQMGIGLPEIGGLDANLLSLLIAGSSDARAMQLTANQLIAADVNGDGSYTAADLAALEQRAIRSQTGFLQNNGALQPNAIQSWRFFPKSRLSSDNTYRINNMRYTDSINVLRYRIPRIDTLFQVDSFFLTRCDSTVTSLEIMSILLGDINANNLNNNVSKGKAVDEVKLWIPPYPVIVRNIPIYAQSDSLIYGVDAKIENYAANMQIIGYDSVQTGVQVILNADNIQKKTYLTAYSTGATAIQQQVPIAYLKVQYLTDCVWQSTAFGQMSWYLNGQTALSRTSTDICTGTGDPISAMEVHVFPNPTDGRVIVRANQALGKVQLWDSIGRLIQTTDTTEMETELDLSMYANGLYIIKMGNNNFKVLKQ